MKWKNPLEYMAKVIVHKDVPRDDDPSSFSDPDKLAEFISRASTATDKDTLLRNDVNDALRGALLGKMRNKNEGIRKAEELMKSIAPEHINEWGLTLFQAARREKGNKRVKYAVALQTLESFVTPQQYRAMLDSIMTNASAIEQLVIKGRQG